MVRRREQGRAAAVWHGRGRGSSGAMGQRCGGSAPGKLSAGRAGRRHGRRAEKGLARIVPLMLSACDAAAELATIEPNRAQILYLCVAL
jgi:hypothetical protein